MKKTDRKGSYSWLLHLAIWAVLFGMPFFSPRPGHPLHGNNDYTVYLPVLASFLLVFYTNYIHLIEKYLFKRKFWQFILSNLVLIVIASIAVHMIMKTIMPAPVANPIPNPIPKPHDPHQLPLIARIGFPMRNMMIYLAIICAATAVKMTEKLYQDEQKRQELEKNQTEAELAALRSQINPHFLFNTLNNIYSLIQIDQDKAQEAVHDLSGMLRYVLYESSNDFVPMEKEISFIKDYIKLMSMRLSPDVKLEVNLPETCSDTQIAPMLFIPLVENAFKHGVGSDGESFIKISIQEDGEYVACEVTNSLNSKDESDHSGSGIGIKNLGRRLEMIYPGRYTYEQGPSKDTYSSTLKIKTA